VLFICYLNWTDQGAKAVKGVAARHENLFTTSTSWNTRRSPARFSQAATARRT
jgi:uncharacterized protein with GYD domain